MNTFFIVLKPLNIRIITAAAEPSFDESRYYEMDSALNLAMAAQRELMEAVGRLRETEEELEDKKKKVLFLQKTRRVRINGVVQRD